MKVHRTHRWNIPLEQARQLQHDLRSQLISRPLPRFRLVAGADVSFSRGDDTGYAAVVVLRIPEMTEVEVVCCKHPLDFPYIPGYLSFREIPVLESAFKRLKTVPDVVICDGHGTAHPRGFGIACHLGLLLQIPALGCGKSKLVGEFDKLGQERGSRRPLVFEENRIGEVLRTRTGVKPVFVSPGHLIDLESAVTVVQSCLTKYRLPETTRRAHRIVNDFRRQHEP